MAAFLYSRQEIFPELCSMFFAKVRQHCCSFAQSCPTLCDPMDGSTSGLPVCHQLPELAQTHVHRVGDAIQPSHAPSSPSPPAPNLSQHQGLFQWVSPLHEMAKVLEFSFSISPSNEYSGLISFRIDWFDLSAVQETLNLSSLAPQFESISSLMLSLLYSPTLTSIHVDWKNQLWLYGPLLSKWFLCSLILCLGLSWLFFQEANGF